MLFNSADDVATLIAFTEKGAAWAHKNQSAMMTTNVLKFLRKLASLRMATSCSVICMQCFTPIMQRSLNAFPLKGPLFTKETKTSKQDAAQLQGAARSYQ